MNRWLALIVVVLALLFLPVVPFSFGGTTLGTGTAGSATVSPSFALTGCGAVYDLSTHSSVGGIGVVSRVFSGYTFGCSFHLGG